MSDLNKVGDNIYKAVKLIEEMFTEEELEEFIEYTHHARALAPFVAFQEWRSLPSDAFDEAEKRAQLLLKIKKIKVNF